MRYVIADVDPTDNGGPVPTGIVADVLTPIVVGVLVVPVR